MSQVVRVVLAALLYLALAWPASWIALPPGYAAPYAPAAGVAILVATRWRTAGVLGVVLGACG